MDHHVLSDFEEEPCDNYEQRDTEIDETAVVTANDVRPHLHENEVSSSEKEESPDVRESFNRSKKNKASVNKSIAKKNKIGRFVCSECSKRFQVNRDLQTHIRTHTGERPYGCDQCDKRFAKSSNHYRHVRAVHNGEKKFPCNICEKAFSSKETLKEHKRIHDNVKPFWCDICERPLRQASQVRKHRKTHFGPIEKKDKSGKK